MIRRKKKLINSSLQLKLVSAFLAMAVVASLFQVVLLNMSLLGLIEGLGVQTSEVTERFTGVLVRNLFITLGVLIPFMTFFGVVITHRVAGPIHKFERYLDGIARGEEQDDCRIRKGDELQELCDRINTAVHCLKTRGAESVENEEPPRAEAA